MKEVIDAVLKHAAELAINGDVLQLESYSLPGALASGYYIGHTGQILVLEKRWKQAINNTAGKYSSRYFINVNQISWIRVMGPHDGGHRV